jgi:FkbM family methyltransferase
MKVTKHNVELEVDDTTVNGGFWKGAYCGNWEDSTFHVFDEFADETKVVLDIGAWIGPTVLYNAKKFKHVVAVEADKLSVQELQANVKLNGLDDKVTVVPKAVYHELTTVRFGKNMFMNGARDNDSTSQIQKGDGGYEVETVTLDELVKSIDGSLGLIKVDIEGGEEFILEQLLKYHLEHRVPMHISFHYSWWSDKSRLAGLVPLFQQANVSNIVQRVAADPFCSVVLRG